VASIFWIYYWSLREILNEITGFLPASLLLVTYPDDHSQCYKTWSGEVDLLINLGKNVVDFMRDLSSKLSDAQNYAKSHCDRAQARYAAHYNLRSKDTHFTVGNKS